MINYCFFDSESQKLSDDFSDGWGKEIPNFDGTGVLCESNVLKMLFGFGALYDSDRILVSEDPQEILAYLLNPNVHAIVTFNGEKFDFNLLISSIAPPEEIDGKLVFSDDYKEIYCLLKAKSIDLARICADSLGHRVKLASIIEAIFEHGKVNDPKLAWTNFNSGIRTKVLDATNYVIDDVVKLRQIFGVAKEMKQLAFKNNQGDIQTFDVVIPPVVIPGDKPF